ncbi:MAG: tetratricopeptide repeat protein [Acidobacteria bacterium]|nr:tetratricopeptide repeat protein [Acidobacteriota bacterium]
MARVLFGVFFLAIATCVAQDPQQQDEKKLKQRPPVVEEPPEEDESAKPKEYILNPLQAEKELRIGNFYAKKGSFRAAAQRYQEATMWNPTSAEAFLKLAEAREKLADWKSAKAAYQKYLELDPESKQAPEIQKKLSKKK